MNKYKVNMAMCTRALDVGCRFLDGHCVLADRHEDCSLNIGLNQIACEGNLSDHSCLWLATSSKCVEVESKDYSKLDCTQSLNRAACINITKVGEYCGYSNSTCIRIDLKLRDLKCQEFDGVNSPEICERANDAPCRYDARARKCT